LFALAESAESGPGWWTELRAFSTLFRTSGPFLLCVVIYLGQAIVGYWPVLQYPTTTLPCGKPTVGVVALFNAWTIWWNADRVEHGFAGYWDAPVFWPEKGCLALSEPQPLTLLVAPVVWLWGPIVAYHTYFLMNTWLNGVFALLLARRLGMNWWIAGWCGALVVWLPLIYQQPELLQYVPLWPILWTWDICFRILRSPAISRVIELGIAIIVTFAANLHTGVFSVVLLAAGGLTLALWDARKRLLFLYSGVGLGLLAATPILIPVMTVLSRHGSHRPLETVAALSARPSDWLQTPPHALEGRVFGQQNSRRVFNPGWLRALLAGVAIARIFAKRQDLDIRQASLLLTTIACLAVCGSFGPNLKIFAFSPWSCLHQSVSAVSWIRSPYRFAYVAQLAILILSGLGLNFCVYGLLAAKKTNVVNPGVYRVPASVLFAGFVLVEVLPAQPSLVLTPNLKNPPDWVQYLSRNREMNGPILILDFPSGKQVIEYDRTVRAMLWQSQFHLPLVNGYSGFFPENWVKLSHVWRTSPYSREAFELLRRDGVAILIRPPGFPPPPDGDLSPFQLKCLTTTSSGVTVYRLTWDSNSRPIR